MSFHDFSTAKDLVRCLRLCLALLRACNARRHARERLLYILIIRCCVVQQPRQHGYLIAYKLPELCARTGRSFSVLRKEQRLVDPQSCDVPGKANFGKDCNVRSWHSVATRLLAEVGPKPDAWGIDLETQSDPFLPLAAGLQIAKNTVERHLVCVMFLPLGEIADVAIVAQLSGP